jgi:hypothetical protein
LEQDDLSGTSTANVIVDKKAGLSNEELKNCYLIRSDAVESRQRQCLWYNWLLGVDNRCVAPIHFQRHRQLWCDGTAASEQGFFMHYIAEISLTCEEV